MAKKILFVEDEEALQEAMAETLKAEGFEPLSALDGDSGIKIATSEHPDLILLDLILPKKDGFEVLYELKSKEETKDIPVIVFTNLDTTRDIERVLDAGASTYLVKANYDPKDVMSKVKSLLE